MGERQNQSCNPEGVVRPTVGELLREFRKEVGLSQRRVALRAGIDPTNLSRLERDKQGGVRITTLVKVIGALGFELSDERAQKLFETSGVLGKCPTISGELVNHTTFEAKIHETERSILKSLQSISELRTMWEKLSQ